jgi:serine/threonine protein phosphatase PrpC
MNITIGKPYAASEKGGRINNEDSIYPAPEAVDSNQKLFIVCDGVGGSEKGEIASAMACELFQSYLASFSEGEVNDAIIKKALQYTEVHFNQYVQQNPAATGMATTLAMIWLDQNGATLGHIGDSRIYQFRKGEIIHQTEDHSLVYSLYKLKAITKEEMRNHPRKNVITRAIQGNNNPTEIEITQLTDIQAGDYFFICSDGVLEQFSDEELGHLFDGTRSPEACKDQIVETCNDKTKDNFSFYIIPIQQVRESTSVTQNILSFLYSLV